MPKQFPAQSLDDALNGRFLPPANDCPFCGSADLDIQENHPATCRWDYQAACGKCGCVGPIGDTRQAAIEKWNATAQQDFRKGLILAAKLYCQDCAESIPAGWVGHFRYHSINDNQRECKAGLIHKALLRQAQQPPVVFSDDGLALSWSENLPCPRCNRAGCDYCQKRGYLSFARWGQNPAERERELLALQQQTQADQQKITELTRICQKATDTLGVIDDWLSSASTRESAMDSIWLLNRMLKQAGFEYEWRRALNWRGATMKELNEAGFFKNSEDGFFHYDPTADKEKPYRIYGNAQGPTIKEYVETRERELLALRQQLEQMRDALVQGLANEGQDGCFDTPSCQCWRCKARKALKGGAQ